MRKDYLVFGYWHAFLAIVFLCLSLKEEFND